MGKKLIKAILGPNVPAIPIHIGVIIIEQVDFVSINHFNKYDVSRFQTMISTNFCTMSCHVYQKFCILSILVQSIQTIFTHLSTDYFSKNARD